MTGGTLRRMLLAMANDLRIVLLRLASRLQTLRYFTRQARPLDPRADRGETMRLLCATRESSRHLAIEVGARGLSFRFLDPDVQEVRSSSMRNGSSGRNFIVDATQRVQQILSEAACR